MTPGQHELSSPDVDPDRHATNVMFNCMRGGVIASEELPAYDVLEFVKHDK